METKISELEIEQLKSEGVNFDYILTQGDYVNYTNLLIGINGYTMKNIVSKLQPNEKLILSLNLGNIPMLQGFVSESPKSQIEGSIYWNNINGKMVRIKSDMGSISKWVKEMDEIFSTKQNDETDLIITIPPDEDLDDNGNYIGNDPEFLKSFNTKDNIEGLK